MRMYKKEEIVHKNGREVIIKQTNVKTKYFKGKYDKCFRQIRHITPITKAKADNIITS